MARTLSGARVRCQELFSKLLGTISLPSRSLREFESSYGVGVMAKRGSSPTVSEGANLGRQALPDGRATAPDRIARITDSVSSAARVSEPVECPALPALLRAYRAESPFHR